MKNNYCACARMISTKIRGPCYSFPFFTSTFYCKFHDIGQSFTMYKNHYENQIEVLGDTSIRDINESFQSRSSCRPIQVPVFNQEVVFSNDSLRISNKSTNNTFGVVEQNDEITNRNMKKGCVLRKSAEIFNKFKLLYPACGLYQSRSYCTTRRLSNASISCDNPTVGLHHSSSTSEHNDRLKCDESNSFQKSINKYTIRSHTCGELRISDVGKQVTLCGWIEYIRMNKFILLRDAYGSMQILTHHLSDNVELPLESVIRVTGVVIARPKSQINQKLPTGEIEIEARSITVENKALSKMPFLIRSHDKTSSKVLNKYRFLALRFPNLQSNLRLRSKMLFDMRKFLITQRKFVEIETPTLFKKTPGGAQEFIVPTQFKNRFYSLVQSPQQLKQLLMVGAIDRYFQIARCYRDEKTNPERQPEFTQLDIELSFTNAESIMQLTEEILLNAWPESKPSISIPFPKMTYQQAFEKYGSDKPYLMDKLLIHDLTNCIRTDPKQFVYMFSISQPKFSFKQLRELIDNLERPCSVKVYVLKVPNFEKMNQDLKKMLPNFDIASFKSSFTVCEGDVMILSVGCNVENTLKTLGSCRHKVISHFNMLEEYNGGKIYEFVWVVDFPLLEKNDSEELKSTHHPFTCPHPDDMHLVPHEAIRARSLAYDLVLNGSEIGGGSMRIHKAELQRTIFKLLGLSEEDFSHLLEALEMGCPPHGGIALGLDRLFAILCHTESIKDVIAFPKGWEGQDLMTGCPNDIPIADKIRYHIHH